jgi:hypothetical protein
MKAGRRMRSNAAAALIPIPDKDGDQDMSDTVDERVTRAREYLRVAQQRDILHMLPSAMMVELGESRRHLAALLAVIAERQDDAVTADLTESRQLAEVRQLLADFDWEFADRQYALEAIERIVTGGEQ